MFNTGISINYNMDVNLFDTSIDKHMFRKITNSLVVILDRFYVFLIMLEGGGSCNFNQK